MGRGRAPCCDKSKVKKGPWSPGEDLRLINFIQKHGHSNWRALPKQAGLLRCGKSCRLRWINYLSPDVKRGNFTSEEEQTIINLHNSIGNKWSKIASYLPGRTDNEIKNVWNTHLKKRLLLTKKSGAKMDYSASPSCTSSSITTSGEKSHIEMVPGDDHDQRVQESEIIQTDSIKEIATTFDSPTSSYASNCGASSSRILNNTSMPIESETNNLDEKGSSDNEKIDVPYESDIDFWSFLDSLDPIQFSCKSTEVVSAGKIDGEMECKKWLRYIENELGLIGVSEVENEAKEERIVTTNPQLDQEMNLEPEIGIGLDYFPIWPPSPQNLGI